MKTGAQPSRLLSAASEDACAPVGSGKRAVIPTTAHCPLLTAYCLLLTAYSLMRLAYFSPLTPQRSGISDYSEELLPHLARGAEITLFVDGFAPASRELVARFPVRDFAREPSVLRSLAEFDAVVYHLGNDHRYHAG